MTELNINGIALNIEIGQEGASAIAQAISNAPSLALKKLIVRGAVENDEHLKEACKARGVQLV